VRLNPKPSRRIPVERASPEGGATRRGTGRATVRQWLGANDEGTGRRRGGTAPSGGKTLKSEPCTWQRGEIDPQGRRRRKPSRACETLRTELSGVWKPCECGRRWLMSRRGMKPQERILHHTAGVKRARIGSALQERESSGEDELVLKRCEGRQSKRNRETRPQSGKVSAGVGNQ